MEETKFNISEYIKNNSTLKKLDFITVYATIAELIHDGKMELILDVQV